MARYYTPDEFAELRDIGLDLGFTHVQSSPLTRSSYHAWEQAPPPRGAGSLMATTARTRPRPRGGLDPDRADVYRDWLRQMLLIRRFEEKAGEAYSLGKIGGFCHLYIGQEAVAVGSLAALGPDDYITCSYREHGHALARGITARTVMAELFGKAAGWSKGKGGSMHLFDASLGFLGGHGIVGGHIPLATGMAFAAKYRGHRAGGGVLLRRGRGQQRRLPRGAQHGRALEAAGDLPLREQPLRHGHRARAGQRDLRHLRARLVATTWRTRWWTARTC